MIPHRNVAASILAVLAVAACSRHAEMTAERSLSPLIGTWTRDGNVAKAGGDAGPQFTKLSFQPDGRLSASYVAANIGAIVGSSPSIKSENDTYATSGNETVSIAEGTRHLTYGYRVDGTKLYLTPSGGSDVAQFSKAP